MGDILVIGIAGGSGSGKSTLINKLAENFGRSITVINHDDYYLAQHELALEERRVQNYDRPQAFETSLMTRQLKMLKDGNSIYCPVYDYDIYDRTEKTRLVTPTPVILIDGILVLENEELRNLFDIKIYVDTDADVRILRRIKRDVCVRGRTIDSVTQQYITTVKPMHEKYIEPSKKYADIIIPEGGYNAVALDMIINRIARHLSEHI